MLNEKNPLAAQALSDDDLDGVAGGVVEYNGVTYNTYSDVPPEIMEELIALKKSQMAGFTSTRKSCWRCRNVFSASALTLVNGRELCPDCAFKERPRSDIEAHQ